MRHDWPWHATNKLTRAQLSLMLALGDQIGMTTQDWRHRLDLTPGQWRRWADFLAAGPLPAEPRLPDMLRRLATLTFRLSLLAEQTEPTDTTAWYDPVGGDDAGDLRANKVRDGAGL